MGSKEEIPSRSDVSQGKSRQTLLHDPYINNCPVSLGLKILEISLETINFLLNTH